MNAIDTSSVVGLIACYLLTLNLLLGLLLGGRYNPWTHWPHRRFNYFRLHNWTGYLALAVAVLHPLILLTSSEVHVGLTDIVYPVHFPKQPLESTLGAVALYITIVVVATSYVRHRMSRLLWKRLHYLAYAAAAVFYLHGILADPHLQDRAPDLIDAEKVSVEVCLLLVAGATVWRVRHGLQHRRQAAVRQGARRAA